MRFIVNFSVLVKQILLKTADIIHDLWLVEKISCDKLQSKGLFFAKDVSTGGISNEIIFVEIHDISGIFHSKFILSTFLYLKIINT